MLELLCRATRTWSLFFVLLLLALFGALPRRSHRREWGYRPTGAIGIALVIVVILVLLGRI